MGKVIKFGKVQDPPLEIELTPDEIVSGLKEAFTPDEIESIKQELEDEEVGDDVN